jgi:hypothetical protein
MAALEERASRAEFRAEYAEFRADEAEAKLKEQEKEKDKAWAIMFTATDVVPVYQPMAIDAPVDNSQV